MRHPYPLSVGKWPPELELHQPRRVFSALLICLSYLALDRKWSDTPVLRRASPDPKSGGNAGSLVSVKTPGVGSLGVALSKRHCSKHGLSHGTIARTVGDWPCTGALSNGTLKEPLPVPAKKLPDMDSNHDNRCNRPAGCLTSSGNKKWWRMVVVRHWSLPASLGDGGVTVRWPGHPPKKLVRPAGIAPASPDWHTGILLLNDGRDGK